MSARPSRTRSAAMTRLSSAKTRSAATVTIRGALAVAAATVSGSDSIPNSQAKRARRSVRSGSSAKLDGPDHPQAVCREVAGAVVGVDDLAAGQRPRHRVDGEVALGEILGQRGALQAHDVDLPAVLGPHDAPGAEGI